MTKTWCPLPWNHISIKGNGAFRVCCHSHTSKGRGTLLDENGKPVNVRTADWDEVRNSNLLKEVRLSQLKGEWHSACIRCEDETNSGMQSRIDYERDKWSDDDLNFDIARQLTNTDGSINPKDFPIEYLDIRFGNLCNLKCIMCSPTDSSQWYNDYVNVWGWGGFTDTHGRVQLKLVGNRYQAVDNPYDWYNNENIWNQLKKHKAGIERIYIVGGEPLIIEEHYDFLQHCIDSNVAKNIDIEYNSNITNVSERALEIWKHFKSIRIGISIDAVGLINELIRFPSKWSVIEKNLGILDEAEGNFSLWITASISVLNLWHLPDFLEWKINQNFKRINSWKEICIISPHPVHRPLYLNVQMLPKEGKKKVEKYFNERISSFTNNHSNVINEYKRILNSYIEFMNMEDKSNVIPEFYYYMDKLDEIRGTAWREIIPELEALLTS